MKDHDPPLYDAYLHRLEGESERYFWYADANCCRASARRALLYLAQNTPNAKLILYPDASHGSWYEYHEDFVFETNRFLDESDRIATVSSSAAAD